MYQQGRQSSVSARQTKYLSLRLVRASTVDKEKQYYILWVCVCSLVCPACRAHAPYYVAICGLSRSTIFFPHYLINRTNFGGKNLLSIKCVLILFASFVWNVSHSKNNWVRYHYHYHHHHHHVQEGLGLIPVPCILKMKLVPPSLPRSSYVSSSFWFIL